MMIRLLVLILIINQSQQTFSLFPLDKVVNAQAKYRFQFFNYISLIPANTNLVFDFSSSLITPPVGALTVCEILSIIGTATTLSNCSCDSNKLCTIVVSQQIGQFMSFNMNIGLLSNPGWIEPSQQVQGTLQTSPNIISNTIYITGDKYSAGTITLSSLGQASFKVGFYNDYTINIKLNNAIPVNGQIKVKVVAGYDDSDMKWSNPAQIDIKVYDNVVNTNVQTTKSLETGATSYIVTNTNTFLQSQIVVETSKTIQIVCKTIRNPIKMAKSGTSIQITTMNTDSKTIDQILTGIQATSSEPVSITFISIQVMTISTVGKTNKLRFKIQPLSEFQVGGYLQIEFPSEFTLGTVICQSVFGLDTEQQKVGSCIKSGQNIRTMNMYYPDKSVSIQYDVDGITNPISTKPTTSFIFKTYDSGGLLLSSNTASSTSQFTATKNTLSIDTVIRSSNNANSDTDLTIKITIQTKIVQNSLIQLKLKKTFILNKTGSFICNKIVQSIKSSISCSQISEDNDYFILQTTEFCSISQTYCNSNSIMELEITNGLMNPLWVENTLTNDALIVSTMTNDGYVIDEGQTQLSPVLDPVVFIDMTFTRSVSDVGGAQTVWTMTIDGLQYGALKTANGNIIIYYPRLLLSKIDSLDPICTVTIGSTEFTTGCTIINYSQTTQQSHDEPIPSIHQIQFGNICQTSSNCGSMTQQMTLKVSKVRNYLESVVVTASSTNYFGIRVNNIANTQSLQFMQSSKNTYNKISISQFHAFSVATTNLITGKLDTYTFTLNPNQEFPQTGYMYLTMAGENILSSNLACSVTIDSKQGVCEVDTTNKRVKLMFNQLISDGSVTQTDFTTSTKVIQIVVSNINNPYSTKQSSSILIQSFTSNNIGMQSKSTTITMTTPNSFQSQSVTRSVTTVSSVVELILTFQITNIIPTNTNYIEFKIAKDQVVISDNNGLKIDSLKPTASQNVVYSVVSDTTDYLTIKFNLVHCPCITFSQEIQFKIYNGLTNPISTKLPTNDNEIISKTSDNYLQDKSSFKFQPSISAGTLTSISVTPNVDINSLIIFTLVEYTLNIVIKNPIPIDGIIHVNIPDNVLYHSSSSNIKVTLVDSSTLLSQSTSSKYTTNTNFNFIKQVVIQQMCKASNGCTAGTTINLKIHDQLYSSYSNIDLSNYNQLSVQSFDASNNIIDSGLKTANVFNANQLSSLSSTVFYRSSSVPGDKTVYVEITITLTNMILEAYSIIRVTLPNDQIQLIDNINTNLPVCQIYVSNTLQTSSVPCPIITHDTTQTVIDINEFCSDSKSYCVNNSILKFRISNIQNGMVIKTALTSDILINLYKTLMTKQQFQQISTSDNKRFNPELSTSQFQNLQVSLDNYIANIDSHLQLQFSLISPIVQNGYFIIDISESDFLLNTNQKCEIAQNYVLTDPYIDYKENSCTVTTYSTNGQTYYKQIKLVTTFTTGVTAKDTKIVIRVSGRNRYYSKTNSNSLVLKSQSSNNEDISSQTLLLSTINVLTIYTMDSISIVRTIGTLGTSIDLTFEFSLKIRLLQGSTIQIKIPKNQQVIASSKTINELQCYLQLPKSMDLSCTKTQDTYNFNIQFDQQFCNGNCAADTKIKVVLRTHVLGNPTSVLNVKNNVNYKPLEILGYYQNTNQMIFKSKLNLEISPELIIPQLKNVQIQRDSGLIQKTGVKMYFQFQVINEVATTDKIQIIFPDKTIYTNDYTSQIAVQIHKVDNLVSKTQGTQITTGNVAVYYSQDSKNNYFISNIEISNYCTSNCPVDTIVYLQMSLFSNPKYVEQGINDQTYIISIMNQNQEYVNQKKVTSKYVVENLYSLQITDASVVRTSQTPDTATTLTVKFNNPSFTILANSFINLLIPISQFNKIQTVKQLTCKQKTGTVINNCYMNDYTSNNNQYLNITFKEYCSSSSVDCSTNQNMEFTIEGLKNGLYQPAQSQTNSIMIQLLESYLNLYGQVQSVFPNPNIEGSVMMSDLTITRDNNVAGNNIVLDIRFKLLQNLQTNSKIYLQLPEYAFYNRYTLTEQQCMDINNRVLSSTFIQNVYLDKDLKSQSNRLIYKYIQEVQINDLCSQMILCSKDTTVQIKVNLRNQISTANYFTNAKFNVLLLDQSQIQQSQGYLANTLSTTTAGLFNSPTFTSSNSKVKATNVNLCLKTTLTNTFSSIDYQGKLQITIPSQLLQSKVLTVTANIQEIQSLSLNPSYDSNNIITINYSQAEDDLSLKTLNVCINGITNPSSNLKTDSFVILSNEYISKVTSVTTIDNSQSSIQYQVTTLGTITINKFIRDQDTISSDSQLTLEFKIENEVMQGSVFVMNVKDSSQMEFNSQNLECKDIVTNSVITCSKDTTSITFDSFCKSSKCSAGSIYKIQVTKGLKNVDYVKSKTSLESSNSYFKLYSQLPNTGQVDSALQILVTPYMKNGIVQLTKFTRSINTIFQRTTFDLHVTSQSKIFQTSVLAIQVPNNFLEDEVSNSDSIYCFKLTTTDYQIIQQISCNVIKYTGSIYNEVKTIRVNDICSQTDCGSNYQLAIRIDRIRNIGYYKPIDTTLDNLINIKFQAISGQNQYDDIDIINIKQQSKFSDLSKQGLMIMEMRMVDPNPNTKTQMVIKLRNSVGTYIKSGLQINFVDGFSIDASKYKVRILSPYSNQGSCSSYNEVLKVSDIFNQYINYGSFMIIIDDITTPKVTKDYQGFKMQLNTLDNNLITDTDLISTNKDVKLSIFNRLNDKDCDGQCLTCGPQSDKCLSCYNPSKYPLFDYQNKKCSDKCKDGQYLQESPSIVTSILPTYSCESCDIECKQCWGPSANQCTTCEPSKVFSDGECIQQQECPFTSKIVDGKCQLQDNNQCNNNCATCGPSKSFCYSCPIGYIYESDTGKCILSTKDGSGNDNTKCTVDGYYVDQSSKMCKKCKLECKTCTDKDTCLTCNTFYGNYYQHKGQCIEQCPLQYFSTQDRICQKCVSNCDNCLDSTSCYNCQKPYKLIQTTSKCESECPSTFYYNSESNLCQSHECSNKKCYNCDKTDTTICTSCSKNTLYEVLFNNQCYSPTDACKIQQQNDNVFNTRIQVCQQCHLQDCIKCGLTDDQLFQKCEACTSNKYLYKGQCYTRCPTGLQHSINRDNSITYIAKCLDVTCKDSKCKYCNPNTLSCYDCMTGYYLLDGSCVQSCGNSYVIKTNSDNIQYCHNLYVGNPGGYTIFIWVQLFLFSVFIGVSVYLKKTQVAITSSFISLFTVTEFFIRIGLFSHLYLNNIVSVYVVGINFICIFTNCGIGFLFKTLYISLYEQNLKTFSNFKFSYSKFYKFSIIGTIAFGVMFNEILVAALIKFPKAHFYRIRPFRNSLLKMQQASFILSLFQIVVNIYVIIVFIYVQDEVWYLSLTGTITNIIINVCFFIRKHMELKAINNHLIKPDNQQYDSVNKE